MSGRSIRFSTTGTVVFLQVLLVLLVTECVQAQENPDPTRFAGEIEAFGQWDRKNAVPHNPIVFIGSSSIRMWLTAEHFPQVPVVNRGFGGSHISDVLHYLQETVLQYTPRAIVFYAGDNDIAGEKSPEQVFQDYRMFVDRVHDALPEIPVFFIPIKPSLARWSMWPRMQEANAGIRSFSEQHPSLFYVDTATPMLGQDGTPMPALFLEDGLHMTEAGYAIWTRVLAPYLEQVMAQPTTR